MVTIIPQSSVRQTIFPLSRKPWVLKCTRVREGQQKARQAPRLLQGNIPVRSMRNSKRKNQEKTFNVWHRRRQQRCNKETSLQQRNGWQRKLPSSPVVRRSLFFLFLTLVRRP